MTSKQIERRFDIFKTAAAIMIALLLIFIVIALISDQPLDAIKAFVFGPFQKLSRIGNIFETMTPILFTGVAISVMYQANQFNMIGEGAFLIAANLATWFAIEHNTWPRIGLLPTCLVVGIVAGMASAFIPALLKIKYSANEVVSSLMMNSILLKVSDYILLYITRDTESGNTTSYPIPEAAKLPKIWPGTNVHAGIILAAVIVVVAYIFVFKTKWGYQLRMVGANPSFAKYSGISVLAVAMSTQLIGGSIAGLGGASQVLGAFNRFSWYATSPGYGSDGVMVGVLAKNNPLYVPLTAFFLAFLRTGAAVMNRTTDVPVEIVDVAQGLIIMLVAAEMFLSKYKHKLIVKNAKKQLEEKEAK